MIPEINIKLETRIVETEVRGLRCSWFREDVGHLEYTMSWTTQKYWIVKEKTHDFIKRLTNRRLK